MRRFRRPRRGFRMGRLKRQKTAWVTSIFIESAIDVTSSTAMTEFVLVAADQDINPMPSAQNLKMLVRRIICKGGIMMSPLTTAVSFDPNGFMLALYTIDAEDADASIITGGTSSILLTERILWHDCLTFTGVESTGTTAVVPGFMPGLRIDLDVKLNVSLRNDELLVLGIQPMATLNNTITVATASMASRCLVDVP